MSSKYVLCTLNVMLWDSVATCLLLWTSPFIEADANWRPCAQAQIVWVRCTKASVSFIRKLALSEALYC